MGSWFNTFFSPPFILYFRILLFLLFVCKYLLFTFYPIVSKIVERSKRRSYFLSLVFTTKCFTKNLLLNK